MILENQIEKSLIDKLISLKYTYRPDIRDKQSLEANFRKKFEELNCVQLSDSEFAQLKDQIISRDVFSCSQILRDRNTLEREDGTPLNYTLVNTKDWCKNYFEVINQLRINTENSHHRYDVILLINGVPVVQIELKTVSISPRKAMQQIVEYKNTSGTGYNNSLLCFIQLFIVSNRTETWYFANNNNQHFSFDAEEKYLPVYQFADEKNKKLTHLSDFAEKFLAKCTLGEMISRYMVLVASEQKLLMMRPYQIYAVKSIVDCIHQNRGNGYIWHTTGSGKTLTSFKASTLLKDNPDIEKCLFVVDRKDLDKQTRDEFNKFQEGCVEENTNTETLVQRLLSTNYADKVIVTTIQKLGIALDENSRRNFKEQLKPLKNSKIVFIFDECHRSQFGENHKAIREFFPQAQLFGFTGTPIFEKNASYKQLNGEEGSLTTTDDIFEKQLHAYTITHAIEDRNVLRFHVDYFKTEGEKIPKQAEAEVKEAIVEAILEKHDAATAGRKFNAIFATSSINDAIQYYRLFKQYKEQNNSLNVVCIFSPPSEGNKDIQQIQEDLLREKDDNQEAPEEKKIALKEIIADYNLQYKTNHSINEFDLYYQDVQKRIKDQKYSNKDYAHENKIDLIIVVDMLLTGFDSKYLNTLYVDKELQYHGLIQAFSRTNRILNDTKPYGNILDFRGQKEKVDEAIALFSGEKSDQAKEIWLVDSAPVVVEKLDKAVSKLDEFMESQGLSLNPKEIPNLKGDAARAQFINLFKEVQRLKTQLDQYTDLSDESKSRIEEIISSEELLAFRGVYLETSQRLKEQDGKGAKQQDPEVEQLDFEFVLFASAIIDYDYIVKLISDYTEKLPGKQTMTRDELIGIIAADAKFINEKEDIEAYISTLKAGKARTEKEIHEGYQKFKQKKKAEELAGIALKHGLSKESLQGFVDLIIARMIFDGERLTDLMAPLELGWKERASREEALMLDLIPFLKKLAAGREISGLRVYEE